MKKTTVQVQSPEGRALALATKEIKRLNGLYRMWRRVSVCLCVLYMILTLLQGYAYARNPHPDDAEQRESGIAAEEMTAYTCHVDNAVIAVQNERIRKYGRRRQRAAP
ncbi:MAG: hypothetical protein ACI3XQ_11475 [Eubacteriales bacterium]